MSDCIWTRATPQRDYTLTEGEAWLLVYEWTDIIVGEVTEYQSCGHWRTDVIAHAAQRLRLLADTLGKDRVNKTVRKEFRCMTGGNPQVMAFLEMLGPWPEG